MFNGEGTEELQQNGDMLEKMDTLDEAAVVLPKKPRTIACTACGEAFCSKVSVVSGLRLTV